MLFRHTLMRGRRSSYREWVLSLPARSLGWGRRLLHLTSEKNSSSEESAYTFCLSTKWLEFTASHLTTDGLKNSDSESAQSWSSMKLSLQTRRRSRTYSLASSTNSSGVEPTSTE